MRALWVQRSLHEELSGPKFSAHTQRLWDVFLPHLSSMFLSSLSWVVWLCTQGISPPALESVSPRSSPPTSRDTPKAAGSALGGACGVGCSGPSGRARAIGGSPHPRRGLARPSSAQPAASLSGSETDAGSGTGTSFGTGKWEQGQVLPRQKDGTAASCRGGPGMGR